MTFSIRMNQWCKVCDEPAAGFHFGAFTCEGCKSFFGRAHTNPAATFECKTTGGRCMINKKTRTSCKACRLKKCLAAGMSKSGSRYGRRSNWFKIHCLLQQQQRQLQRIPRKGDRCGGDDDDDANNSDGRHSDPLIARPWAARLPVVPLSPAMVPLLFGLAPPVPAAPLPRSERSAFRETVGSNRDAGRGHCVVVGVGDDDDDDQPIDLTVRPKFAKDDDDDNNNEIVDKYDSVITRPNGYNWAGPTVPLDLTRSNGRKFGIRS